MSKIGRNDPCPCGSGKKYKRCCLPIDNIVDVEDSLFERYNSLLTLTKLKLEETYIKEIKNVRQEARQIFLQHSTSEKLATEQETLFSDWLWFDKMDSSGNTLGFHYLQVNSPHINPMLSATLTALSVSYISIYEVVGMEGELLLVKDIFTDYEAHVIVKEAFTPENKSLLLGRLILMPEGHIFSGMVLIMEDTYERREFLTGHFDYIKKASQDTDLNILKFRGNLIFGLFDHAYNKVMVNLNDIRYASINKDDLDSLNSNLSNNDNFEKIYKIADYHWFELKNNEKGYVKIAINEENLILCADVIEDVYFLQDLADSLIPDLDFTLVRSNIFNPTPKAELFEIWFTVVKDQETDKWLRTPMRDLEGRTPTEVLQEAEGKNQLLKMLDSLENANNTEEEKDFLKHLKTRVNLF